MEPHDWSRFLLRIPVKADTAIIYSSWATQEGLEKWFLRKAAFTKYDGISRNRKSPVEVNDTYEWLWHGWSDEVVERGKILEMNGKDALSFSFGKAGNVDVTIRQEQNETIVELVQRDISTDESSQLSYHIGCTKGWLFYLTNLKSVLEGGIDLRNKNAELKEVINS
jgi:hypothetical protein